MKFRKKPVIVEASCFLVDEPLPFSPRPVVAWDGERHYVTTQQGEDVTVRYGEWVILENPEDPNDSRAYPCDPFVFARTYEPAEGGE